jgi:DNA-dependent RNA polymerase auxiliary subunit epsilon
MKVFRFEIHTTSYHWEIVDALVEAESEEEARKLFEKDPWLYDWDNWESCDSELLDWDVNSVEEITTHHIKEEEK